MLDKIREINNIYIFDLKDEITLDDLDDLCKIIDEYLDKGKKLILFNLSNVQKLSILGVGFISAVHKKIEQVEGAFVIFGLNKDIKYMFSLSNHHDDIEICDAESDAVRFVQDQMS